MKLSMNAMLSKMIYNGYHNKGEPNLRMRKIYKLRIIDCLTWQAIGEEFDITGNRAQQIYDKGVAMATGHKV